MPQHFLRKKNFGEKASKLSLAWMRWEGEVGRDRSSLWVLASPPPIKNLKLKIKNDNEKFKIEQLGINDSKALRSRKREQLADKIKECSLWSVAEVGVGGINKVGIGKATKRAMRCAIK